MPFLGGRTKVNSGTLTIKNLILADSGLYDCIATNAMGTKKTRINVVVQRKPGKLYIFNTKSSRVLLMNLRCSFSCRSIRPVSNVVLLPC